MKFESDVSLTPEQALVQQLEAHETVETAIVFDALASGMMTKETAKDKLDQVKERHSGVIAVLKKKYGDPNVDSFLNQSNSEESETDATEQR